MILIFRGNGTEVTLFRTTVANIGSPIKAGTSFLYKAGTYAVTLVAGTAVVVANEKLIAGIGRFTPKSVDTEVVGIIETASVPGINHAIAFDFLRDGGGVFTEILRNILKGKPLIQRLLYV